MDQRYNAFDIATPASATATEQFIYGQWHSLSDRCPRDVDECHFFDGLPRRLMELDLRLMLTIGTCLVSIVSAAAIAKVQIKNLVEDYEALRRFLADLGKRMDMNDQRPRWSGKTMFFRPQLSDSLKGTLDDNRVVIQRTLSG